MARPLRIQYEGAYYHVMSRGRGRQVVFHGTRYFERFIDCLDQAHRRFALEVHAYCLMGNHYHLLVRTPRGNLARAMRHVNGVYTQYHNFLKKTDGPLFRGRYKAINVEASSYLLAASRYIHRNPVEKSRPLVKHLPDYRWSSYPAYLNKATCADWLYTDSVYEELESRNPARSYERYVEQGNDVATKRFYAKDQWPAVRGSKHFAEKAYSLSNADGKEVRSRDRQLISPERILSAVALHLHCDRSDLIVARRGPGKDNRGRNLAMKLCQELGGMKLSEMATLFNVGSDSAVSRAISRLNTLLCQDQELGRILERICRDLSPKHD